MLAILALNCLAGKEGLALVASSAHALRRQPSRHHLSRRTVWHCQRVIALGGAIINHDTSGGRSLALLDLGLGPRETRAFLATGVLTVAAEPVMAE